MDKLNKHILSLLNGGEAHAGFETILEKIPENLRNSKVKEAPHTLWELLEHIRLAQQDILDYMIDPEYKAKPFPEGYWPEPKAPMHWDKTVKEYQKDLKKIKTLIKNVDLLDQLPYGERGHTYLREMLILADHQSYHSGQMVTILRLAKAW